MIKSIILKDKEVAALVDAQKVLGSCASPAHQHSAEIINDILERFEKSNPIDFKHKKKSNPEKIKRENARKKREERKTAIPRNCCKVCKHSFLAVDEHAKVVLRCAVLKAAIANPDTICCSNFEHHKKQLTGNADNI